jgi:hypothetical protein
MIINLEEVVVDYRCLCYSLRKPSLTYSSQSNNKLVEVGDGYTCMGDVRTPKQKIGKKMRKEVVTKKNCPFLWMLPVQA